MRVETVSPGAYRHPASYLPIFAGVAPPPPVHRAGDGAVRVDARGAFSAVAATIPGWPVRPSGSVARSPGAPHGAPAT